MASPMSRSLEWLREHGYTVDRSESWLRFPDPKSRKCEACGSTRQISARKDLFGFSDIVAVGMGQTIFVQTTDTGDQQKRIKKISGLAEATVILSAGNFIHVHGWYQRANRRWHLTIHELTLDEFGEITARLLPEEGAQ